jgi:hypothetical protein
LKDDFRTERSIENRLSSHELLSELTLLKAVQIGSSLCEKMIWHKQLWVHCHSCGRDLIVNLP